MPQSQPREGAKVGAWYSWEGGSENKQGVFLCPILGSFPPTQRSVSSFSKAECCLALPASPLAGVPLSHGDTPRSPVPLPPPFSLRFNIFFNKVGTLLKAWCEQRITLQITGMVLNVFSSADLEFPV